MKNDIWFVRIDVPALGKVLAVAVEVEGDWVKKMMPRALSEGLDEESCRKAIAIDSVRLQMEAAGLDTAGCRVIEARAVSTEELHVLLALYNPKEKA